ncbi:Zn-ribbon domain-containing OB-fold protein [Saccharopolyspora mangrovi]|uniref:OB-fold domain-containing protein n=1 Tax=Saccharopolyspora mangrovi TaxID=3082379 RepID=A0ABU6AIR4_9PSEU|nr:OB-fold domain-containing protein [Saccharopolyspora sp. S2-29]MEB3371338.1 OB-fold domain-containing protein [Saccharopolyspora sp. S2-29]
MPELRARRDEASAEWFDGLAEGNLLIKHCPSCGHESRPDATACPGCRGADLEWATSSGAGTVVSLVVDHGGPEPQPLGLVELDEGPWLHVRLVGAPDMAAGDRVRLTVSSPEDGEPLPVFVVER